MRGGLTKLALSSGAAMAPALAYAQAVGAGTSIVIEPRLDRMDVAGSRIEPAYQTRPLILGPFFAKPAVSVVGGYDSNVFNRPDDKVAAFAMLMPSLILRADVPRHEVAFSAAGTIRRFSRAHTENSEEFVLSGEDKFDLGRRQSVKLALAYAHLIEPRSSTGSIANAAEPVSYRRLAADLGSILALGRVRIVPSLRYERLRYDAVSLSDGGKADQSFRDMRSLRAEVRVDYDFSGLVAAFATGSFEDEKSTSAAPAQRRSSKTAAVLAGLHGELSPVISAEIGVGYQSRDYVLPAFRDVRGLTYRADVQWYVTPLVTLRAQASRSFRNSGDRRVGGILTDAFELSAYHDPLPNLRFALSGTLERGDFRNVGTRSWRKGLRVQGQYRISPALSLGAYVRWVRQDVHGARLVVPFTSLSGGLGVTVTP